MRIPVSAFVLVVVLGIASPLLAQQRTPVPGVEKTPLSMCVPGTIEFIHHTRKSLKFEPLRYCTDDDWNVGRVEQDAARIYWTVSFAAAEAGQPDPYGRGDVICLCRKR